MVPLSPRALAFASFVGVTGAACIVVPLALLTDAHASTVIALTLPALVERSETLVVAIPKSSVSRWESGRIVTYTTVGIDQAVAGVAKAGGTLVVRTYGGVVDGVGQITHGEAVLKPGTPMLLFLRPLPPSTKPEEPSLAVTGMAQGAVPIVIGKDKVARVSPDVTQLALVQKPLEKLPPAAVALNGKALTDTLAEVRVLWTAHAAKKK